MGIKHTFQSAKSDGGDATLVRPSSWNADHEVTNYVDLPEGAAPSTPASGFVRVYAKSDGSTYQKDDAGNESGLGLATGTSFPGSPATGARFRRSDIDYMVFFYDGTRWLSEVEYVYNVHWSNLTIDTAAHMPIPSDRAIYLDRWDWLMYISGSGVWELTVQSMDFENDNLVALDNVSSSGQTADRMYAGTRALGDVLDATGGNVADVVRGLRILADEISGTAALYAGVNVYWRYIAT
jgi:hypothetical protein